MERIMVQGKSGQKVHKTSSQSVEALSFQLCEEQKQEDGGPGLARHKSETLFEI
jgi:hypothetical protein